MKKKKEIKATPSSYYTSELSPIEVENKPRKYVCFNGLQVDNKQNPHKNIKGKLVIKRKTNAIEDFSMTEKFTLKDIGNNECVEISFDTESTYNLAKGLYEYYKLFSGKETNPFGDVSYVEKDDDYERIKALLENKEKLLAVLKTMEMDMEALNTAVNIRNLQLIKQEMEDNLGNDKEAGFWQGFFENNAWILAQLFHAPVMFFKGKKYVGGKCLNNHGGQITDYIYKNDLTDNIAIIEIKSPVKEIIASEYRQTYTFSKELIGAVNQLLKQRDIFNNNYHTLNSQDENHFRACNIEAILVYGKLEGLNNEQINAFERFRNELRSITIITFDELLKRTDNLISLLAEQTDMNEESDNIEF